MNYVLDVNTLVAPGFLQHEFHQRVAQWVRALAREGVPELSTCSITELGFIRVLVQAPQYGFSVSQARALLLRLKKGEVPSSHSWRTTTMSATCRIGSRPQSKSPTDTSYSSLGRMEPFLRHWTEEFRELS